MTARHIKLGVNIDHVATIRQARGTPYPDVLGAAESAIAGGADSITVHLREDRRHIQDTDVETLAAHSNITLNLEIAVTAEMIDLASRLKPAYCCLVPEKREELTTEGGLDIIENIERTGKAIARLEAAGIRSALFVDPDVAQLQAVTRTGCRVVELHTGSYADAGDTAQQAAELSRLELAAAEASRLGLTVHAGHGLTTANVGMIAGISEIEELNIGHAIVARALFVGLEKAVAEMKSAIKAAVDT